MRPTRLLAALLALSGAAAASACGGAPTEPVPSRADAPRWDEVPPPTDTVPPPPPEDNGGILGSGN